jgi:predicted kinase
VKISVDIPDDLYRQAREIADAQHLSVDEVIASVFAEYLTAWKRLKQRAAGGSRDAFVKVLKKVPYVVPEEKRNF